ncbi:hypothetical protein [Ruminococcus sp. HUN007]|uniref:hypothetical protein n=1 Tax=Ruminococcus sp. HUN007 TaxID=1514668 RepID=UPI0005D2AD74|nr:hypothetical protein [Ruminococcus sp. HUN007]
MGYFQSAFLAQRRSDWLRRLHSVEVLVGSSWYKGTINQKKVDGENIIVTATFPQFDGVSATITASRIIALDGNVAAYQSRAVVKAAGQGTLVKIKVPLREV